MSECRIIRPPIFKAVEKAHPETFVTRDARARRLSWEAICNMYCTISRSEPDGVMLGDLETELGQIWGPLLFLSRRPASTGPPPQPQMLRR